MFQGLQNGSFNSLWRSQRKLQPRILRLHKKALGEYPHFFSVFFNNKILGGHIHVFSFYIKFYFSYCLIEPEIYLTLQAIFVYNIHTESLVVLSSFIYLAKTSCDFILKALQNMENVYMFNKLVRYISFLSFFHLIFI